MELGRFGSGSWVGLAHMEQGGFPHMELGTLAM